MPQDFRVAIRLDADAKGFQGELRLGAKALARLTGSADRASTASRRLARTTGQAEAAARRSGNAIGALHRRVLQYGSALLGLHTAVSGARALLSQADNFTRVSNAVRLATGTIEAHARVQSELYDIAHRTRTSVAETALLYQRLALSATALGASERDLLGVVEGVGQALAISGTDAGAARGALIQLSQALGGTVVRAEEFNSLIDGAPELLRVVARHLDGVGGSVARLRQLVVEGKVSSREFFAAIRAGLPELEERFGRAAVLIGQAMTQIDNAFTRAVGQADEAVGAATAISGALTRAAERIAAFGAAFEGIGTKRAQAALEELGDAALLVGSILGGRALVALTAWGARAAWAATRARAHYVVEAQRAARIDRVRLRMLAGAAATRRYGRAVQAASIAVRGLNRALLSGPLAVAGLVAYGAYEIYNVITSMRDAMDDATQSADEFRESLEGLSRARLEGLRVRLEDRILDAVERQDDARTALSHAAALAASQRAQNAGTSDPGEMEANQQALDAAKRREILSAEALDRAQATVTDLRQKLAEVSARLDAGDTGSASPRSRHPSPSVPFELTENAATARAAVEQQLQSGRDALATPWERATAAIDRWEAAARQAVERQREASAALSRDGPEGARNEAVAVAEERLAEITRIAAERRARLARENADEEARIREAAHARELAAEQAHIERRQELLENAATARAAVEQQLQSGRDALATPWERATAAIDRWEAAARQAVERQREASAALSRDGPEGARNEAAAEERLTEITRIAAAQRTAAAESEAQDRLRASRRWQDGARRAFETYADAATNAARIAEGTITKGLRGMEDGLTQFVATGKLSIESLADSIIASFARIAVQQTITGPLASALGSLFGGGGGGPPPLLVSGRPQHTGGIAGALDGVRRNVPPAVFAGASRYHAGGIAPDEVPAILRRGEGVFTPEQMRALSPAAPEVTVNVINQGTGQRVVEQRPPRIDGRRLILDVVTEDIAAGGRIPRLLSAQGAG